MRSKGKRGNQSAIKAIDFFCGAGGVTRGLLDAGIDVMCGIDNDLKTRKIYQKNNQRLDGKPIKFLERDINELTFEELKSAMKNEKFEKLMFVGCAPCQPFTNISTIKDKREGEKNYLLRFFDFIEFFRPEYLFIENVPGITAEKYGNILGRFKEKLERMGYNFSDRNVNAKKYGVPQNRNRRILIASLSHDISFPEETHGPGRKDFTTVKDVLKKAKLKSLNAGEADKNDKIHRAANLSEDNLWRIKKTQKDGGTREIWMDKRPVKCFLKGKKLYSDVYSRMYWNKPSPTITTRFNSLSNGRFGHPEEDRAISLREGALFQTFPIWYEFEGSMGDIARHIGNAVPVDLAKVFGRHFINLNKTKVNR